MEAGVLYGVLTALLSSGIFSAVVQWRQNRAKQPLTERHSHIQDADILLERAMKQAENATERATESERRLDIVEKQIRDQGRRLAQLGDLFTAALAYIESLLRYIKTHLPDREDHPGAPSDLRDHIYRDREH